MIEEWLPITGYDGLYEVSSFGRIRSLPRTQKVPKGGFWLRPGRLLKPKKSTHTPPRLFVELYSGGVGKWKQVHRLVIEAFQGPAPGGHECCHRDGDPSNNRDDNLRWGTPGSNMADKLEHGTLCRGDSHGMAKLTATCIERLRDMRRSGCTITSAAKWIGISRPQAGQILAGQQWAHV